MQNKGKKRRKGKVIPAVRSINEGGHVFRADKRGVLLSYEGLGGEVMVPQGIFSIGAEAFAFCNHVTSVILPEGVERIAKRAFFKSGIKTISLPNTLTAIEEGAFSETPLESIDIPDQVETIGEQAFSDARQLKSVKLPKGIDSLEPHLLEGCVSLTEVVVPESVEYIQGGAFKDCIRLENVALPEGLVVVWREAFCGCSSLREIYLGDNVKALGYAAFEDCTSLEKVRIPKDLKMTQGNAFGNDEKVVFTGPGSEYFTRERSKAEQQEEVEETGGMENEIPGERPVSEYAIVAAADPAIGTGVDGRTMLKPNVWQYLDRLSREELVRELSHSFTAKGGIDGAGWASIDIELDDEDTGFRISYIGASPADFKSFAAEIEDGESESFGWSSEPGWYPWQIQRRGGIFYVSAPNIKKSFFISREEFLHSIDGLDGEW